MVPPAFIPLLLLLLLDVCWSPAMAKVSIPDDLSDVIDEEEDEAWREWGRKKTATPPPAPEFLPPPLDPVDMLRPEVQEDMMRRHQGPSFGFVKLRLGVRRSADDVTEIANRWSKILQTGSLEVTFLVVDLGTVMFTMEKGQNVVELKDFILSQQDAYEVKIGELLFRRPGDPPLDEVVERLQKEAEHPKDEL